MPDVEMQRLVCAECALQSEGGARDWRAFLTGEEGEVDGVEVFCPRCAEQEFPRA